MRAALFQQDIRQDSRNLNLARAEEAFARLFSERGVAEVTGGIGTGVLSDCENIDLLILPEMFATGFAVDSRVVADGDGSILKWMRRMAARYDSAIAGSVAVEDTGRYYNRFYFVRPDGSVTSYDKRHLFRFGGEERYFTAGRERVVTEWRGVRILLQICYDLRFPVFARCRDDYDMIIYVADWPVSRVGAWNVLLRARAVENQCYVAGVNRVGTDYSGVYSGGSVLIGPCGHTVVSCADGVEDVAVAVIDADAVCTSRREFPASADRDDWRAGWSE